MRIVTKKDCLSLEFWKTVRRVFDTADQQWDVSVVDGMVQLTGGRRGETYTYSPYECRGFHCLTFEFKCTKTTEEFLDECPDI
jgi:hypothetical protein